MGRALAKEKQVTVLTSRWVLTQKTSEIVRCRLVVRRLRYGRDISLECWDLRDNVVFGRGFVVCSQSSVVKDLSLLTAGVFLWRSCANFLSLNGSCHAPVEAEACDLVLLPAM